MESQASQVYWLVLITNCQGKTEIGDYIVDCSACNSVPVQGVKSYSCKVRCEAEGEASINLTSLYDIVTKLSKELEETKKKLAETQEKLKIDVIFDIKLSNGVTIAARHRVIFDGVISNVGNGYDSSTGIFTVPYNGSYELTLRNMGTWSGMYTNIMRNGQYICNANGTSAYVQGMCTIREKLTEGNQICAENGQNTIEYNRHYNSLSGHLIHLD